MRILSVIWLLFLSAHTWAQTEIKGKVLDAQTKEPLPFVNIHTPDNQYGTTSDYNGNFIFKLPEGADTLIFSLLGYGPEKVFVRDKQTLTVQLEAEILNMQEVVITANREQQDRSETPTAIHKISPKLLEDTKPTFLPEILNKVPGVVMVNLNNEQHAMSIRQPLGYNAYFLYLEDGVPIRPVGVFNHNALIEMNMLSVNSIEVIKGPASSLYGSEAIGGAVNFITHGPTSVPTAKLGFQADNYGYFRTQFGAGTYLTKKLGIYTGGYMAKQRNSWQTYSDFDKLSLNFRADYYFNEKTKLVASYVTNDYDSQMGGSVDSAGYYDRKYISLTNFTYRNVKADRAKLTLSRYWNRDMETFVTLFYRKNSIGQFPSYAIKRPSSNPLIGHGEINENSFTSLGGIIQNSVRFKFLNSKLITGISLDHSPNDYWAYYVKLDRDSVSGNYTGYTERKDSLLVDYHANLLNSAAYAQFEFSLAKKIKVVTGMRYDRIDFYFDNHLTPSSFSGAPDERNGFNNLTPKVGATYDLGNGRGVYANYSRGFSPPTISQLYRGVKVPELKPAFFNNYEAGGWGYLFNKKIYADLTVYQMNGYNEIISYRLPDNSTENRNSGETLHRGVEYSITWIPNKQWYFRLGGTNAIHRFIKYSVKEGQNFDNKMMPNSPGWIANSQITYKPSFIPGFRLTLEYQRIGSYYTDNDNNFKYDDKTLFGLAGVSVMNVRAGYNFGPLEVYSNVLNVTNELYANIVTRASYGSTFTPGAPRVFTFGVMYNFSGKE